MKTKIQIIGPPRSGTTSLYEAFRDNINYTTGIFEPINQNSQYKIPISQTLNPQLKSHLNVINSSPTNIIEKNVIFISSLTSLDEQIISITSFYKKYLISFDKIIFIYRNDIESQAKSLKNCMTSGNWFFPYKPLDKVNYEDMFPIIEAQNTIVKNLSNFFNIPLTYYEDLYSNNINYLNKFLNSYNIKLNAPNNFYFRVDTKNRLKQS